MVIKRNSKLTDLQWKACKKFEVIPIKDFQISLAFWAQISKNEIQKLAFLLRPIIKEKLTDITATGLGGAFEDEFKKIQPITTRENTIYRNLPRVYWWNIANNSLFNDYRNSLTSLALSLGTPIERISPTFYPHILIGAAGSLNSSIGDFTRDIQNIINKSIISSDMYPSNINIGTIQFACLSIHDFNLYTISEVSTFGK